VEDDEQDHHSEIEDSVSEIKEILHQEH